MNTRICVECETVARPLFFGRYCKDCALKNPVSERDKMQQEWINKITVMDKVKGWRYGWFHLRHVTPINK